MEYGYRFTGDESDLIASLNKVISRVEAVEKETKKLGDVSHQEFHKSAQASKKLDSELRGLNGNVGRASGAMRGLFSLAGRAFAVIGVGAAVKEIGQLGIQSEQTAVAFETFLGSAAKAKQVIADLTQFSIVTPFSPEQVTQAGKALLAFGLEQGKLIPTLRAVGDVAAGTGKDFNELAIIYGKARTAGVVFSEDINQLTEAGVPIIDELANSLNVATGDVKKLAEQGKIGFPDLEKAFANMTSEGGGFFDLMNKQSQTVGGRISTLVGDLQELAKALGQEANPAIGNVVDKLDAFVKAIDPKAVIDFFSPIGEKLLPAIQDMYVALSDLVNSIFGFNDNAEQSAAIAQFLKDAFAFLVDAITATVSIVTQLIRGFKDLYENSEYLQFIFSSIGKAISFVVEQFQIFFDDVIRLTKGSAGLQKDLIGANEALKAQSIELQKVTDAMLAVTPATEEQAKKQIAMSEASKKAAKELAKFREEYAKVADELRNKSIESGIGFLDNFERLDTERQLAIEEVKKFEAEVRKAAKNAKKTLTKEEEDQIRTLYENTEREFAKQTEELVLSLANQGNSINRAIGSALSGGGGSIDSLPNSIDANAQKRLQSLGVAIGDGLGAGIPEGLASGARDSIDRFLGQFSAEELDFAKQQFGNFAGEVADAWVSSVDIQIAQNDRLIQAYDQRIAKQSEALSREFELLKAGFANNYDAEKQNLEALEAQREVARKKGEDLAKKAARRQILVDTAQQISSLVTAAANIQKGTSSVPFVGVAIGLGLIATLIGAFSKFKAQAAKAAEIPKFGKGDSLEDFFSGEVIGRPHSGGGVPASAAGRPIELEGKEFITNAADAQEHKGFLHHLNRGGFRGVDLMELVAPAHSVSRVLPATREAVALANEAKSEREASLVASVIEKTFSSHLQKHGDRIVGAIGRKKSVMPIKDGHVEEWEEGEKTIRKVVHHI